MRQHKVTYRQIETAMRYAIVNNTKEEAAKGIKGLCPSCGSELIAKCGERKINHWAHKGIRTCDPWWEPETEWHRSWKSNYPSEWQEITLFDNETSEKNIADVRTIHQLIIEFQHSHIDPNERRAREKFYKNMIWVVDGTRLKRDYSRFINGTNNFTKTDLPDVFFVNFPEEVFPATWLNSSVPVIFDFFDIFATEQQDGIRNSLWILLPRGTQFSQGVEKCMLVRISRKNLVQITHNRGQLFPEKPEEVQKLQAQQQAQMQIKRREPTHYLHKDKWVKRRRF